MRVVPNVWKSTGAHQGILFFAQAAEELMFDFSPASYRLPTLNSKSRIHEAVEIVKRVRDGDMNDYHVEPIIHEVIDSLRADPVCDEILEGRIEWLIEQMSDLKNLEKLYTTLVYIDRHLTDSYRRTALRLIRELVLDGVKKREIHAVTSSLLAEWVYSGYSKEAVYFRVQRIFFGSKVTDPAAAFENFLNYFTNETKKYKLYARVSNSIADLLDSDARIAISSTSKIEGISSSQKQRFLKQTGKTIVVEVDALDSHAGAQVLRSALDYFEATLLFYNHDAQSEAGSLIYVKRNDSAIGHLLDERPSEMTKMKNHPYDIAFSLSRQKLALFANRQFDDDDIDRKVFASLLGHASAIKMRTPELQLVALWSALETMLPRKKFSATTSQLTQHIVPGIMLGYGRRVFESAFFKLRGCLGRPFMVAVKKFATRGNILDRFAAAVALPSKKADFDTLLDLCKDHPLARYRLQHMRLSFQSPKAIRKSYVRHEKRVSWQVLRIYRARNEIIHDGHNNRLVKPLLSNLHEYFDTLVTNFDKYAFRTNHRLSVFSAFTDLVTDLKFYREVLDQFVNSGSSVDESNLKALLGLA